MTLLAVENLSLTYPGARRVTALDDVSLTLSSGETLGLIGPSGCGKSTLARVVTRLVAPDSGHIAFDGQDWLSLKGADLRHRRGALQMVFQDPSAAFHPRATVGASIDDALRLHSTLSRKERALRVIALLQQVELDPTLTPRAVASLSGGQRQRVAIARALACDPKLIVLDEATSALDAGVRLRVLELLARLQRELGLAYLFIGHDIGVVRVISHRIAVMEAGRIVETGPADRITAHPQTELTRRLIAAVPTLHPESPAHV